MRPGLYLGGTDLWALHDLLYHVVDNAVDQAQLGRCSQIRVTLFPGNTVAVKDDGPGIPVAEYEETGRPFAELVFTKAAGRWDAARHKFIQTFLGVGLPTVNALSATLRVEIARDGYVWQQDFQAGYPVSELTKTRAMFAGEATGTTITFTPDFTIFEPNDFRLDMLSERFRDLAFLVSGVAITLRDERLPTPHENTFQAEDGLASYVDYLRGDYLPAIRPIRGKHRIEVTLKGENPRTIDIEFACQYSTAPADLEVSFASRFRLLQGRPHMFGLRDALVDFFNRYARQNGLLLPGEPRFSHKEIRTGLITVVNMPNLYPSRQPSEGRCDLAYPELRDAMYQVVTETLAAFTEQYPRDIRSLVDWLISRRPERQDG